MQQLIIAFIVANTANLGRLISKNSRGEYINLVIFCNTHSKL